MRNSYILIYSHQFPPDDGGVARYSHGLAMGLFRCKRKLVVLAPGKTEEGYIFLRIPRINFTFLDYCISLFYFVFLLYRYDIPCVIATEIAAERIAGFVGLFLRFKFIPVFHGYEILVSLSSRGLGGILKRTAFRIIMKKAFRIVVVSEYTKTLLSSLPSNKKKVNIISGGVDTGKFSQPVGSDELKCKLGLKKKKIILTISRLDSVKGHDTVLKALQRIVDVLPDVRYVIAGKGREEDKIRRLIDEMGLAEYVRLIGFVPEEEIVNLYHMCDVFVMPSRQVGKGVEGFGLAFLEANMCGKPVIGGRHGGVPEAVLDGKTGFLVDPDRDEEIASRIIEILGDDKLAFRLGQEGRRRCISFFDWKKVAERFLKIMY